MKFIYDSEQPPERRMAFIAKEGDEPYYGFACFWLKVDNGNEFAEFKEWGTQSKRLKYLEELNSNREKKEAEREKGN
jgi:hypothetical protein